MEKEFIPYNEALALKELGFDEKCYRGYDKNQMLFYSEQENGHELNYSVGMNASAPLYQQTFRWFREKYGFYSSIEVDQTMEPKFCYTLSKYKGNFQWDNILPAYSDLYYAYEEAELACLKKLIEIAKNK